MNPRHAFATCCRVLALFTLFMLSTFASGQTTEPAPPPPSVPPAPPVSPPPTTPPAPPASPAAPAATTIAITIELTDGSRIIGSPVQIAALPLRLSFAQLDIPLPLIASAQFTADRKSFSVKFTNNDTLTGTPELDRIKLKTTYGEADVPLSRIARILVSVKK